MHGAVVMLPGCCFATNQIWRARRRSNTYKGLCCSPLAHHLRICGRFTLAFPAPLSLAQGTLQGQHNTMGDVTQRLFGSMVFVLSAPCTMCMALFLAGRPSLAPQTLGPLHYCDVFQSN